MACKFTLDNPPPEELREEYRSALYSDRIDDYLNWCNSNPDYMEYLQLEQKYFEDNNEFIYDVDIESLYKSITHRIEEIGDKTLQDVPEKRFFIAEFTRNPFINVVNGKTIYSLLSEDKRIKRLIERYNEDISGKYLIEHRHKRVYYIKKK